MTSHARDLRRHLRRQVAAGDRLVGTFLKLPTTDVVDIAAAAGFDLVVVDLEHSALSVDTVLALVRHATALGLPALVRVPDVDAGQINRLLEAGAAGIQLSGLASAADRDALVAAARYAPVGHRSISLSQPTAGFGQVALREYLDAERAEPPFLVGQIETAWRDPLPEVVAGLDIAFVGTTDLMVSLGLLDDPAGLAATIAEIKDAARATGTAFGGWAPSLSQADTTLPDAALVLVGSDLQLLADAMSATTLTRSDA